MTKQELKKKEVAEHNERYEQDKFDREWRKRNPAKRRAVSLKSLILLTGAQALASQSQNDNFKG